MALSIQEQEICINAMRDEEFATAYCSDRTWITKFDKLVEKSPNLFEVIAETDYGKSVLEMLQTELEAIKAKIVELTAELEVSDESTEAIEGTVV